MEIGELKKLFDDMTIEEKAGQLFQTVGAMYDDEAVISGPMQEMGITEKDIQLAGTVLGTMGAEKIKRIQKKYMEAHPHHIPLVFMLDIINGYKTVYPIPLAQGATFQPDLVKECAAMAAKEGAADGLHITFSPMVDLVRDARWGRVMESTGEDVYLNGLYARAMVEGYQGADISGGEKLGACVKHFAGYGGAAPVLLSVPLPHGYGVRPAAGAALCTAAPAERGLRPGLQCLQAAVPGVPEAGGNQPAQRGMHRL